jgi:hypothetical protein
VWSKREVETAFKKWRDTQIKDQKSHILWKKYEGAMDKGWIDPVKVENNLKEIEKDMNINFNAEGAISRFFGKRNTVENTLGISRSPWGGDGDASKRKKRQERADKKRQRKKERAQRKKASDLDIFDEIALQQKEASLTIIDDIGLDDYLDD